MQKIKVRRLVAPVFIQVGRKRERKKKYVLFGLRPIDRNGTKKKKTAIKCDDS